MEVEALHGAVSLWARLDVLKPATSNGVETIDTNFEEGNVKDLKATWRLKKVDAQRTELTLEVFLNPKLPLPSRLVNEQNVEGSALGVLAMRTRVEGAAAANK